ncbi:MAG: glycosyltransferase [Anaerolineales bacterium]
MKPLRLLFVADFRSPTARNWSGGIAAAGHEVHWVSTYPCAQPDFPLASLHILPLAFSETSAAVSGAGGGGLKGRLLRAIAPPALRTRLRQWFTPLGLPRAAQRLRAIVDSVQPDLLHALRIPYEGMLAAQAAVPNVPLLISIWGNDFTLHAPSSPWMARLTRQTLARADALHSDCRRDVRLARQWGFAPDKPSVVLPGGGGIDTGVFFPAPHMPTQPVVVNPRGLRAYVRNDTFFAAIPLVLRQIPQARFVCPAMHAQPEAEAWVRKFGIQAAVDLLPNLTRLQMAEVFRSAQVVASITTHDGTPNSLLEALACGCYPVTGDLESIREWITPGINGELTAPANIAAVAEKLTSALKNSEARAATRAFNQTMIAERAEQGAVMRQAQAFYFSLLEA